MKEKILKEYPTVPPRLYVKRKADFSLAKVIKEMLRPAYISVARQMGKTNLILNAKRELEDENNLFVYIYLATEYRNARDCFRSIIDSIIEQYDNVFGNLREEIDAKRKNSNLLPADEYNSELKFLLSKYKGNVVIILDEVDYLAKDDFSDEIFGQIRKKYFIDNSFPVLKRLTYVLSGIIEPNKLVKNKDNSPFNIAIRIPLDDFSKEEFLDFINRSEITLTPNVVEYIYSWTNGNPRITYDLCSHLEDLMIERNILIDEKVIDVVIQEKYLTYYQTPPIDHIRELIQNDSIVRDAVRKIHRKEIVSDEIKNKLYLYGVVGSNNDTIKNKIIDLSITEEWLNKIDLDKKGLLHYGIGKIDEERNYKEGIKYLIEYIDSDNPSFNEVALAKYYVGCAYQLLGKYEQSNSFLLQEPIRQGTPFYYNQLFITGLNYYILNKSDEAIERFAYIISQEKSDNKPDIEDINLAKYYIGCAYHSLGNYEKSNSFLLQEPIKQDSPFYYNQLFIIGLNYYILNKPDEAIERFVYIINQEKTGDNPDIEKINLSKFYIGSAYQSLRNYEQSNSFLLQEPIKPDSPIYNNQSLMIGLNYYVLDKFDEAIERFEYIVKQEKLDETYFRALINLSTALLYKDLETNKEQINSYLSNGILKLEEVENLDINLKNEFKTICYFNLAFIQKEPKKSIEYYNNAYETANILAKPKILNRIYNLIISEQEKEEQVNNLIKCIIDNQLELSEVTLENSITFDESTLYTSLVNSILLKNQSYFDDLLKYTLENIYKGQLQDYNLLYRIAVDLFRVRNNISYQFFKKILEVKQPNDNTLDYNICIMHTYLHLGLFTNNKDSLLYLERYVYEFEKNKNFNNPIDISVISAFYNLTEIYRKNEKYDKALNNCLIIEKYFIDLDLETKANSIVIYFRIIDLSIFLRKLNQGEIFIKKALDVIKEIEPFLSQLSTISKEAIINFKNRIIDFSKSIHKPIRNENKKAGRNDRIEVVYQNGQRKQGKYKDLEEDIRKGLCIIDKIIIHKS